MPSESDRIAVCERQIEILNSLVHMLANKMMMRSELRVLEERAAESSDV